METLSFPTMPKVRAHIGAHPMSRVLFKQCQTCGRTPRRTQRAAGSRRVTLRIY